MDNRKLKEPLLDSETMGAVQGAAPEVSPMADWTFQNRDVIKWMERIKRGEEYRDDAAAALKAVGRIAKDVSRDVFMRLWGRHAEGHPLPSGLSVDADIKSPVIKKMHAEGDTDEHFVYYKDYPFYYVWNVSSVFTVEPDAEMERSQERWRQWYVSKMSGEMQDELLRLMKKELGGLADGLFSFRKGSDAFDESRIHIVVSTSLNFVQPNGGGRKQQEALFRASKDYADMVVNELSLAMGRILHPTEADDKGEKETAGNG